LIRTASIAIKDSFQEMGSVSNVTPIAKNALERLVSSALAASKA